MAKIIAWMKNNKFISAIICGLIACAIVGSIAFLSGYVKGCNNAKEAVEEQK
jgi:hypothetical protein